ncbi:hypothetical protein KKG90_11530 [Candidatus Bipolaricaulota bacterium]|nr:hypothetical protein [Candidatus Bipolaricaulota bacterium]
MKRAATRQERLPHRQHLRGFEEHYHTGSQPFAPPSDVCRAVQMAKQDGVSRPDA